MFSRHRQSGYTIVEIIVMGGILAVGLLSTVTIANVSFRASERNEDVATATNLAREGVELVRNIRDSNWQAYSYQLKQKAEAESRGASFTMTRSESTWDCYVSDAAQSAVPNGVLGCAGHLAALNSQNFILHPPFDNSRPAGSKRFTSGVPYLLPNNNSGASTTQSASYMICPNPDSGSATPAVYQPSTGCTSRTYYRRILITRGKEDPTAPGTYNSFKVTSAVTWDGNRGGEVIIEEYIANWKRFTSQGVTAPEAPVRDVITPVFGKDRSNCQPVSYCRTTEPTYNPTGNILWSYSGGGGEAPWDVTFRITPTTNLNPFDQAKLIIVYNNMPNLPHWAPPNYAFDIQLRINGTQIPAPALPIEPGPAGNQVRESEPIPFTMPSGFADIQISWINNVWNGYDPNFGIYQIRVVK